MTTRAVGIDLGTTFSAIAHVNKHGVPEILHNAEGDRITPTVILFEDQEVVVGNYAKQSAVVYPERVAEFVKRRMGEKDWRFNFGGRDYSPEQISSVVLAKLKHDAELRLGHRIDQAVITVPAHFGEAQRQATMEAGRLAGLEVLKLLNEPTAAAFAYGLHHHDQPCLAKTKTAILLIKRHAQQPHFCKLLPIVFAIANALSAECLALFKTVFVMQKFIQHILQHVHFFTKSLTATI